LIDLADEIAYNTADLDDAFSAHMFGLAELRESVPQFERMHDEIEGHFPGATERIQFQEVLRGLIDWLVSGLVNGTAQAAASAAVENSRQVREFPRRLACFTPETQTTNRELKQFLHRSVYYAAPLVEGRAKSSRMIAELFQFFLDHPDRLPESYLEAAENAPLHRLICDYIAGMTDGFFMRTYEQLLG